MYVLCNRPVGVLCFRRFVCAGAGTPKRFSKKSRASWLVGLEIKSACRMLEAASAAEGYPIVRARPPPVSDDGRRGRTGCSRRMAGKTVPEVLKQGKDAEE